MSFLPFSDEEERVLREHDRLLDLFAQCQREGHDWLNIGWANTVTHKRCRRCGSARTVSRDEPPEVA